MAGFVQENIAGNEPIFFKITSQSPLLLLPLENFHSFIDNFIENGKNFTFFSPEALILPFLTKFQITLPKMVDYPQRLITPNQEPLF